MKLFLQILIAKALAASRTARHSLVAAPIVRRYGRVSNNRKQSGGLLPCFSIRLFKSDIVPVIVKIADNRFFIIRYCW